MNLFWDCLAMSLLWYTLQCEGYFRIAVVGSSYSWHCLYLKFAGNGTICARNVLTMRLRLSLLEITAIYALKQHISLKAYYSYTTKQFWFCSKNTTTTTYCSSTLIFRWSHSLLPISFYLPTQDITPPPSCTGSSVAWLSHRMALWNKAFNLHSVTPLSSGLRSRAQPTEWLQLVGQ